MNGAPNRTKRSSAILTVTRLEDRIAPLVGATAVTTVAPGGAYDGVVAAGRHR